MDDPVLRLTILLRVLVPFLFFMASVYLALHIVFSRFIPGDRPSTTLWFFAVVTGPLTRPIRAVLPAGMPEARVRLVALAVYTGLWLTVSLVLARLAPVAS